MNQGFERRAGWLLPVFSVRRHGDLGVGDTAGMVEWIQLAADHRVRLLQLLPINETGSDDSPYNAISSMALEPLFLTMDPDWLPGSAAEEVEEARDLLAEAIRSDLVDYSATRTAKLALLRKAFDRWSTDGSDRSEFAHFQEEQRSWLPNYTAFRWLMTEAGGRETWDQWPDAFRTPERAREFLQKAETDRGEEVRLEREFLAWIQWVAATQWQRVREAADAAGVRLMGDVPIGISYYSADVFFEPRFFDLGWCGGAPPEKMFMHDEFIRRWGQNWGIPLYRWDALERDDFSWWRRRIGGLTRVFHAFRIDHVLGFYRIFGFPWRPQRNAEFLHLSEADTKKLTGGHLPRWVPRPDDTPRNRRANRADGDRRLKMVLEAAGGAEVIGEDLGCVPDYVRPHLASIGIAGFRIPHWDASDAGRTIYPEELPYLSLATYATHDHDPLAVMWPDLIERSRGDDADDAETAASHLRHLLEFAGLDIPAGGKWPAFSDEIRRALIAALLRSGSRDAVLMLPDFFGWTERFNLPGVVGGENWRWRIPFTAKSLVAQPELKSELEWLRRTVEETGRA